MTTSKSDFWGGSYAQVNTNSTMRKWEARLLSRRMNLKDRELVRTLLGAAAGSTATKTYKRIVHSLTELGGKRLMETVTLVGRATTSADVTNLNAKIFAFASTPTTYAYDKARQGTLATRTSVGS
jgi:hypothetical protein